MFERNPVNIDGLSILNKKSENSEVMMVWSNCEKRNSEESVRKNPEGRRGRGLALQYSCYR